MEPASTVQTLPYRKDPRGGQLQIINAVIERKTGTLNCQLPTGYGKTFTAYASYAALRSMGLVDRLLYVVPSVAQLDQLLDGAKEDFADVVLDGPQKIFDLGYSATLALKAHRNNTAQVFACTIQALVGSPTTWEAVTTLLAESRWIIVIDEYHHYAIEATWGRKACQLPCVFRLAMSATPYRKERDSAFGEPEIRVTYRQALKEGAVKKLICHSYVYRIDAVLPDGNIRTYTTEELVEEAGSTSPDKVQKMMVDRAMRWSPKYVSPLVDIPIARMTRERLDSGLPQQVLIGAMCCSHAELVCEQVKAMFPELRIDWVGTGDYGRPDVENRKIIKAFCPPKRLGDDGKSKRHPEDINLDVLVHVGMAGEGLDSVYVTEVIHLNPANINNQNNQENGRSSRIMDDLPASIGYINVDSSSPYAKFVGEAVMDLMDDPTAEPTKPCDLDQDDPIERMLPEEPRIRIVDMECIRVDQGEVDRLKAAYIQVGIRDYGWDASVLNDPSHLLHLNAKQLFLDMRRREAEQFNTKSIHEQWLASVERARSACVTKALRKVFAKNARYPSSLAGDFKRKITQRAFAIHGPATKNTSVENLQKHYKWYVALESEIVNKGLPLWLQ
jgi:hypothetical protein